MMIIQAITTLEEMEKVPPLIAAIWGDDPSLNVPTHILRAVVENGGLLLGAYVNEELIGFTLGWLGTREAAGPAPAAEQLKLASHMNGVLGQYRDQKVGFHLKLAQRQWALERGLALITWTYDPLESRNGRLNVGRLGATCRTYLRNVYGIMVDQFSGGIVSDRFRVDWRIATRHVEERLAAAGPPRTLAGANAQLVNPAALNAGGHPQPADRPAEPSDKALLVEIPADMQAILRDDIALGATWRMHTRAVFESLFGAGYQVTDLIYQRDSSPPRSFYYLEKIGEEAP